jgi:hypothetical protein
MTYTSARPILPVAARCDVFLVLFFFENLLGVYFDFLRMEILEHAIFLPLFLLEHFHELAVTFKKTAEIGRFPV